MLSKVFTLLYNVSLNTLLDFISNILLTRVTIWLMVCCTILSRRPLRSIWHYSSSYFSTHIRSGASIPYMVLRSRQAVQVAKGGTPRRPGAKDVQEVDRDFIDILSPHLYGPVIQVGGVLYSMI